MSEEPGGSLRAEREKTDFLFTGSALRFGKANGRFAWLRARRGINRVGDDVVPRL